MSCYVLAPSLLSIKQFVIHFAWILLGTLNECMVWNRRVFLNTSNETVRTCRIYRMKLCGFTKSAEWKWMHSLNISNEVDLLIDFYSANFLSTQKEACVFVEYRNVYTCAFWLICGTKLCVYCLRMLAKKNHKLPHSRNELKGTVSPDYKCWKWYQSKVLC